MSPVFEPHDVNGPGGLEAVQACAFLEGDDVQQTNIELLIADDEPESINEISDYLERKGFVCHKASDGKQVISIFENSCNIGIVITDIKMPGMDGLEAIRTIREGLKGERDVKTIIVTGNADRDEAISALQNGASDFITKPISLKHLAHSISRCVKEIEAQRAKKRDNKRLKKALEQERKVNHLQREFVSMVSHEFRTPLAIIDSSAQKLVRKNFKLPPEQLLKRMEKIRSSVARMINLIESVLSSARFESGQMEFSPKHCDLFKIVSTACAEQREISVNHTINTDLDTVPHTFTGDQGLLDMVFANLLSNAVKYSPRSEQIEVSGHMDGDWVVVMVKDHGVGIPENELATLFKRFSRASTSVGIPGTGIGLFTAKKIIELHGGDLSVTSKKDAGATFVVRLPCAS